MSLQRNGSSNPNDHVPLSAFVRVSISPLSNASITGSLSARVAGDIFSARVSIPAGTAGEWLEFSTGVVNMTAVRLWWPHTMGEPFLYNATVTFVPDTGAPATEVQWHAGFRTVSSVVDKSLQGQVFSVNGERIFLQVSARVNTALPVTCHTFKWQGGNFITTDILNRAEFRAPQRYWDEVRGLRPL